MQQGILNYKVYGTDGPDLIILHGFLGSLDNWQSIAQQLAIHFRVITVDSRNHGRSFHHSDHTLDIMAIDLENLAKHLHLTSFYLLGHSMGGKVAMYYTQMYAHRVRKLIVADIAPRQYPRGHDSVFEAIHAVNLQTLHTRKDAEQAMLKVLNDLPTVLFLTKSLFRTEDGAFEWRFNIAALELNYSEIIAKINFHSIVHTPSLFLKGEKSKYIQSSDWDEIQSNFSNVQLQELSRAGHWLHADNPTEFIQYCESFLHADSI